MQQLRFVSCVIKASVRSQRGGDRRLNDTHGYLIRILPTCGLDNFKIKDACRLKINKILSPLTSLFLFPVDLCDAFATPGCLSTPLPIPNPNHKPNSILILILTLT